MGVYWAEIADQNKTEKQLQFLKTHLKAAGYVLDLACGSGRHSIALSTAGYSMVGLDASRKLLRIAKQQAPRLSVVLGDMRFLPFKTGTFAATASIDTSFGYLPSEADDRVSLAEVRRVLLSQGVFVLDVFNRENLTLKYKGKNNSSKWKEYPRFILQQKRTISEQGDWLCDSWAIHDRADGQVKFFEHTVRLYEKDNLQSLLEGAGFKVNQVYGGYEGEPFGFDSSRLIFVVVAE
jgi:ubiquinone/menaquinone biosynthesis C-methylase UbiE